MYNDQISTDEEYARRLQQQEFGSFVSLNQQVQQQQPQHINSPLLNTDEQQSNPENPLINENEQQPPPPMNNNGRDGGRAIRRDVINDVRNADTESARILIFRTVIALIELIATVSILSIGWNEDSTDNSECESLKYWLLIYTSRNIIIVPLRIYIYRLSRLNIEINRAATIKSLQILRWLSILSFLCFLIGQTFLFTGKTCQTLSPVIWYYCMSIIILVYLSLALPFLIVLAICICLPCVLIVFRFFAEPEGASDNLIRKLPTRKVQESELHRRNSEGVSEDDGKENEVCAICMQEYKPDEEIRVLPCGHEFHSGCVDKWLPMKKICPLCRHDITKPVINRHQSQVSHLVEHTGDVVVDMGSDEEKIPNMQGVQEDDLSTY